MADAGCPRLVNSDLRVAADRLLQQTAEQTHMAQCISDPHLPDCPIVYCNDAFLNLTGYAADEVIGRNCRFLQGPGTSASDVAALRSAVESQTEGVIEILNYRKDGTGFWNAVHVGPIRDEAGNLEYFFGSQSDISELLAARQTILESERVTAELRHRTDNLFAVVTAIVRLSTRGSNDVDDLSDKIQRRIEALASAHRISLSADGLENDSSDLGALVHAVLRPYRTGRPGRLDIVGERIELPRRHVTPVGLCLHELATNALKYGALARSGGNVRVDWEVADGTLVIHWIEQLGAEDGLALEGGSGSAPVFGTGTGSRLMKGVIGGVGGTVESRFDPGGLRATIRVPEKSRS